ncbi:MAG: hypothetical protein M0Q51_05095 [Bacteroidales bacterium]|nr:hypothetical protein [Bacteroidales bacterium]
MKKRNLLYIIPLILLASCKPNIDEFSPSKGNADFSRYIAVGDSWTAGFADGSLYISGQENSYPNILAGQFSFVGGGSFKQPLMVDEYGFGLSTGVPEPKLEMGFREDCKGAISLLPGYADVQVDMANFASIAANGPYNNIGLPGLKSFYMGVVGMATLHPYYGRFASSAGSTIIGEIPAVNATFFTLWLGSYDVLSNAISGGVDPITTVEIFTGSIQATLDVLTANGAKGAVANVPDITDAAFFHTIPYNVLAIDQATADLLNGAYAGLNQLIKSLGSSDTLHFIPGQNPIVIQDASLPWGMRQIKSTEFVLLSMPQDSLKCAGWGSQKPVPSSYILDETEIASIKQAVDNYNVQIDQLISGKDIALVDMNKIMKDVNGGLVFDNVKISPGFATGNFYSTDGLNPTPVGSAVIAYYFIDAINTTFGAKIPQVIVSDYPGVTLP